MIRVSLDLPHRPFERELVRLRFKAAMLAFDQFLQERQSLREVARVELTVGDDGETNLTLFNASGAKLSLNKRPGDVPAMGGV